MLGSGEYTTIREIGAAEKIVTGSMVLSGRLKDL
jgi:hypothetical protein